YHGGDGLGDPLDRTPEHLEEDLNGDFLLPRFVESVYGAVAEADADGRWTIDRESTEERRAAAREDRRAKAVPVREWMAGQRERILAKEFAPPVQRMYEESMKLSPRWASEFRAFWDLPEDFMFDVPTPSADLSLQMLAAAQKEEQA